MKLIFEDVEIEDAQGFPVTGTAGIELEDACVRLTVENIASIRIDNNDILAIADLIRTRRGGPAPAQVAAPSAPIWQVFPPPQPPPDHYTFTCTGDG